VWGKPRGGSSPLIRTYGWSRRFPLRPFLLSALSPHAAIARLSRRGWRIDKAQRSDNIIANHDGPRLRHPTSAEHDMPSLQQPTGQRCR
jgi:hypothetical protein